MVAVASTMAATAQTDISLRDVSKFEYRAAGVSGWSFDSAKPTLELLQENRTAIYRRSYTADFKIRDNRTDSVVALSDKGAQQIPVISKDNRYVVFARENNLFLKDLKEGTEKQITFDGKRNHILNGTPDWVNEEEFSNNRCLLFTNDSRHIVWVRYDETNVKEYSFPLYRGITPEEKEYEEYPGEYRYKYPMAGCDNAKIEVRTYDILTGNTQTVTVPMDEDGYITRIFPTPQATRFIVVTLNRHQDVMSLWNADAATGKCEELIIRDNVTPYINETAYTSMKVGEKTILFCSERSGKNHIYIYSLAGKLLREIGDSNTIVTDVYGYDEKKGMVYFQRVGETPMQREVCSADGKGRINILSKRKGWNSASFNDSMEQMVLTWSNASTPTIYTLCDNKGKEVRVLQDNKEVADKAKDLRRGKAEFFQFTTGEGVTLNGYMVKPADFDPEKKYPVVMFQYGGPGSQQVVDSWSAGAIGQGMMYEHYLCSQGFICVCVDGRGTGGRGSDFEKCTYLQLGYLEARDQVETALYLGSLSYIDSKRIGMWGWSFGGWNTIMSMTEGRPVFAAGVAVAPTSSWRYYDTIYTERFMRTPKENERGYNEITTIARAKDLSGELMIIHGLADDNVHFRQTAELTAALVEADKDFTMLTYTNKNHLIEGGNTRVHLYRQITNYFISKLK